MGRGDEHSRHGIFLLGRHTSTALAAAVLRAESAERCAFDIAVKCDGHDHVFAFDQVFVVQTIPRGGNLGNAGGRECFAHRHQLIPHHAIELHAVSQNREVVFDKGRQLFQLVPDLVAAQRGEAVQTEIEDGLHLHFGELVGAAALFGIRLDRFDQPDILGDIANRPLARSQRRTGRKRIARSANDPHHFIHVGDRHNQTQQDMRTITRLVEFELGAPGDDFFAEGNKSRDDIAQHQGFRSAAANRQHIGRETRLRRRVPPQLVEHHFGGCIALQIDDNAHAHPARFIADIGDAFDPLVLGGFGNFLDQIILASLVRHRSQDDRAPIPAPFLNHMAATLDDRTAPGQIGGPRASAAQDERSCRKVRPRNDFDELFGCNRRVFDEGQAAVDHFAQIVRRNVGCHANRNAARAIDQQIGEAGWQNRRFAPRSVVIVLKINRVLVEIVKQAVGYLGQPRFGVTH